MSKCVWDKENCRINTDFEISCIKQNLGRYAEQLFLFVMSFNRYCVCAHVCWKGSFFTCPTALKYKDLNAFFQSVKFSISFLQFGTFEFGDRTQK